MLDIKFIKDNLGAVKTNIGNRFMTADAELAVRLYEDRNNILKELETLRAKRNENASKMKGKMEQAERNFLIEEGKELKNGIAALEEKLASTEKDFTAEHKKIPNMAHPSAPLGKEEKNNLELKRFLKPTEFSFKPKDHLQLGEALDLLDFENAARVSGTKFYFLKNEAVFLELALQRYALDILSRHGFTAVITPDIAKEEIVEGTGFNPRGEESNIYSIEGTGTCLIGTAEITLGGYHSESILDPAKLPIKLAGLSHCFRREAGSAGQFSKGLYRVHQFSKVEMFVYARPEDSEKLHSDLLAIEEEIIQGLGIPYRVVDTCTGDLGAPAYRKFDIEAWMPGRGETGDWGEITSTSNCTDYQARRLGVRFKEEGKNRFVHMLNGTAMAVPRIIIAILENFQQEDGAVKIPEKLVKYTGFPEIRKNK
jgi:seryl-tRNA synthetase